MGTYTSSFHVQAGITAFKLTDSSSPSTTQVDAWIDEGEAIIEAALAEIGVTVPVEAERGKKIVRSWVNWYAVGMTRQALAGAGGDGQNENGLKHLERFDAILDRIAKDPAWAAGQVSEGGSSEQASRVGSYWTDNDDDLSIEDGDFDPEYTIADGPDQY